MQCKCCVFIQCSVAFHTAVMEILVTVCIIYLQYIILARGSQATYPPGSNKSLLLWQLVSLRSRKLTHSLIWIRSFPFLVLILVPTYMYLLLINSARHICLLELSVVVPGQVLFAIQVLFADKPAFSLPNEDYSHKYGDKPHRHSCQGAAEDCGCYTRRFGAICY